MSGGTACTCDHLPLALRRENWQVTQRYCNHSAFNGYRRTYSQWSALRCTKCSNHWRTKAAYVSLVPDAPADWAVQP